jgi:LacI family transcriptional regulator
MRPQTIVQAGHSAVGESRARRTTLKDVAAAARVSAAVASRALAGHRSVALATRERVAYLAQEMGYRASARAVALRSGGHVSARCAVVTLGLSTPELSRSYYGPVITGIAAQASIEGLDVHLLTLTGDAVAEGKRAEALARIVAEDRAEGLILLTFVALTPGDVRRLDDAGVPYVLVNRHFDYEGTVNVSCVVSDWAGATRDAVERLTALGHRRLALISAESRNSTVRDHERGWHKGIAACDLDPQEQTILALSSEQGHSAEHLSVTLTRLLVGEVGVAPTGVICTNDLRAHAVLTAAQTAGIDVPVRLSVVSFDDMIAAYTSPPLCSYDPHIYELGVAAAALLGATLRGEQSAAQRISVPLDFQCRGSCGPAPA